MPSPLTLHVDIDAFFASVEQLRNPRLARRPVAVGAGVIASCCYRARRFGLGAGMPLSEARRLCPDLVILDGHAAIYRSFAERIFSILEDYSPCVETYLDEAFCDLSGMERLHPDQLALGERLRRQVLDEVGLRVTVGLGQNRMLAKIATRQVKPDGIFSIRPGEEERFLEKLPVRELPGIGPRAAQQLAKLNIHRVDELRRLPRDSLVGMFGQNGAHFYERARGRDTRPVSPREIPRSISRETSFHEPATRADEVEGMLHYLSGRAANTLRKLGLRCRRLEVRLRYAQPGSGGVSHWGGSSREHGSASGPRQLLKGGRSFNSPTRLDSEVFRAALDLLHRLWKRRVGLHLVGLTLSSFVVDNGLHQLDLLDLLECLERDERDERDEVSHESFVGDGSSPEGVHSDRVPASRSSPALSLEERRQEGRLLESLDDIRERYGHSSVVCGRSLHLLNELPSDTHGFVLRTPSLTL